MKKYLFVLLVNTIFFTFSACNNDKESTNVETVSLKQKLPSTTIEILSEKEIIDFIDTWRNVYNTHTFENYIKFYDPVNFKGIKRTFEGKRNVYDFIGWKENKINEFARFSPEVIVENIMIKYINVDGKSKVNFIQKWISYKTSYADEGEKSMIIKKVKGEILIESEELLYSKKLYDYFGGC